MIGMMQLQLREVRLKKYLCIEQTAEAAIHHIFGP